MSVFNSTNFGYFSGISKFEVFKHEKLKKLKSPYVETCVCRNLQLREKAKSKQQVTFLIRLIKAQPQLLYRVV